jgi:hypothetical protein
MLYPSSRVNTNVFFPILVMTAHRKFIVIAFAALMAISASSAYAQKNDPPSGQFGLGINLITNYLPDELVVTYAVDSTLQFGTGFYLSLSAGSSGTYLVSPFARYLFPDLFPELASPFVQAGIQLYAPGAGTQIGFFVGGGVDYCINHQINVHGDVDIINAFPGSPGITDWFVFRLGADYFF